MIDNFRESVAIYQLKKQLNKQPHKPAIHNLQTAQTAGILVDATLPDNFMVAKDLVTELKKFEINSQVFGFINKSRREDDYIGDHVYSFACKKDFNLFYQPKNDSITKFIDQPFDLLIVLANEHLFPIDYIGSLSKAKFKAGMANINNDMFDFMIELKEGEPIKDLKKHILHYLSLINNK